MQIGKLKNRIRIQQRGAGQDELGQPVDTWADLATVWADIAHPSGLQSIRADAESSVVKASIRIRRRADVTAGMRVVYGTTVYDIQAVLPNERSRDYVDLVCEAAK